MFLWSHPLAQKNVVPVPTIAGIAGSLLSSTLNANILSVEYGCQLALAEVEVSSGR